MRKIDLDSANKFAAQMERLHALLREQMAWAQARYKKNANADRVLSPDY
jgi:hypothetical protein